MGGEVREGAAGGPSQGPRRRPQSPGKTWRVSLWMRRPCSRSQGYDGLLPSHRYLRGVRSCQIVTVPVQSHTTVHHGRFKVQRLTCTLMLILVLP